MGTRPEAIKLCPVAREMRHRDGIRPVVLPTGQHPLAVREIADLFGLELASPLAVHHVGQSLHQLTARLVEQVGALLDRKRPDLVMVQGDTTSTFAAALAAGLAQVPVIHLEAGLRSGDLANPFPEELNRRLVTPLAALHLAATEANRQALLREGVSDATIEVIGNTVIDAFEWVRRLDGPWNHPMLSARLPDPAEVGIQPLVLVTAHRRESWGRPIEQVARAVRTVASERPWATFVWTLHPNPAIAEMVSPALAGLGNVLVTPPLGYLDFARLLARSRVVLTDSGGVQEEAPAAGVPVLITREVTERQEVVDAGGAQLVGCDAGIIERELSSLLDDDDRWRSMQLLGSPYGDGLAAARAVDALERFLSDEDGMARTHAANQHDYERVTE